MSQIATYQTMTIPRNTKTLEESVRPQGEGEENSQSYQDFQESSNSSGGLCHLKWAICFESLMQDEEGIKKFRAFLNDQAILANFYIACNGFKICQNCEITTLAKKFYKEFIKGDKLNISKPVKKEVIKALRGNTVSKTIFDNAQAEVENILRNIHYPKFLKSDIYAACAEDEIRCARCGSQTDSPKKWKQTASTQQETAAPAKDNFNATGVTDMSYSFSTMSMSTDRNKSRLDPLGNINSTSVACSRDLRQRHLDTTNHNQSVYTTDHEENIKHASMVTASLMDSSSRSLTSEPFNTDGMSFTSSSRDEKDVGRSKGHARPHVPQNRGATNRVTEMKYTMAPRGQDNKEQQIIAEVNPERFFEVLKSKLLDHIKKTDEEVAGPMIMDVREECSAASAPFPVTLNAFVPSRSTTHQGPSDHDHLRALDESITRIGDRRTTHQWRDLHNVTLPSYIAEQRVGDPQHHPPNVTCLNQSVQMNEHYPLRQVPLHYNVPFNQGHPISGCLNRSFVQPYNHSFNSHCIPINFNNSHFNQRLCPSGHFNNPNQVHMARQQYMMPSMPPNHGRPDFRPLVDMNGRFQNIQDFSSEKVQAWMRTNQEFEYGMYKGSADVSDRGNTQKKSSQTDCSDRTRKVSSSRQSKQSRASESHNPNQTRIHDQNVHPVLNSTSTSTSTVIGSGQKTTAGATGVSTVPPVTIVNYYLVGDAIPYRMKIPGRNITLRQFKQALSKKGRFRYFFKTLCPDFEDGAVHEEVIDDEEVVPLWEGMIVCKIDTVASDEEENAS